MMMLYILLHYYIVLAYMYFHLLTPNLWLCTLQYSIGQPTHTDAPYQKSVAEQPGAAYRLTVQSLKSIMLQTQVVSCHFHPPSLLMKKCFRSVVYRQSTSRLSRWCVVITRNRTINKLISILLNP